MERLMGKVVVVTGGASGLGYQIARQAAERGATAVVLDLDEGEVDSAVCSITALGGSAQGAMVDVRDPESIADAVTQVITRCGRIDVLVNNAGIMPLAFLADHNRAAEAWDRCIDVNLKGTLHGIYAVYDHMIRQGDGHIVNISSVYGNAGVAGAAVYGATEAAIGVLSDALRVQTQGRIKVTLVRASGMVGTRISSETLDEAAPAPLAGHRVGVWEERMSALKEGGLPRRLTDREDICCWVLRPEDAAAQIVHVMNHPLGIAVTDLTLRATGEDYVF